MKMQKFMKLIFFVEKKHNILQVIKDEIFENYVIEVNEM